MVNFEEEMSLTRDLMDELKAEIAASPDPLATAIERPADGMCVAPSPRNKTTTKARHKPHCVCSAVPPLCLSLPPSLDAARVRTVSAIAPHGPVVHSGHV